MMTKPTRPSVHQRLPWLSFAGIGIVLLFTFGNAAANMIPFHIPTARELQLEEQHAISEARRVRVDAMLADGDGCRPGVAREIARELIHDGRSAVAFADDHERRCGADPIVRHWANAPAPRRRALAPRVTPVLDGSAR